MTEPVPSSTSRAPSAILPPRDRQILACIGERYVVFGSGADLPGHQRLGPEDVEVKLSRAGEARDEIGARILKSLVVEGFEVRHIDEPRFGDLAIVDAEGQSALVEVKVGDRDFAGLALGQAWTELDPSEETRERRELWAFNAERLNLGIIWAEGGSIQGVEQLAALDVWEYGPDGSIFDRRQVIEELDGWRQHVEALYTDVELWTRADGLEVRRERTVPMSEGFMQDFAVRDRDMPILDVFDGGKPVVSLVPSGILTLGSLGLIDAITRHGTFRLEAALRSSEPPRWTVVDPRTRERAGWKGAVWRSIVGLLPAGEQPHGDPPSLRAPAGAARSRNPRPQG